MTCPPDVAAILLEILGQGVLQARAVGWSGDAAQAAVEADHIHNLPGLLADYSPARLRYYWDAERLAYLVRVTPDREATFRPLWERLIVVASAIPIAVIANVLRITVTGVLHVTAGHRWADLVFHDLAGWLMMPLALGLLFLELRVLSRLFVEHQPSRPVPISFPDLNPRSSTAAHQTTEAAPV